MFMVKFTPIKGGFKLLNSSARKKNVIATILNIFFFDYHYSNIILKYFFLTRILLSHKEQNLWIWHIEYISPFCEYNIRPT